MLRFLLDRHARPASLPTNAIVPGSKTCPIRCGQRIGSSGGHTWRDERGRQPADARGVITANACGSSVLAAGASIKGAARKFAIDYHALRRHWRNHVSAEARATYVAGAGATKDQLEEIVAGESLGLIDHYRIVRGALCKGFSAAAELADGNFHSPVAACCI